MRKEDKTGPLGGPVSPVGRVPGTVQRGLHSAEGDSEPNQAVGVWTRVWQAVRNWVPWYEGNSTGPLRQSQWEMIS